MPRRCRGIRGDVGIAPYGRATRVWSYNVSPSVMAEGHDTSVTLRRTTQCAPQGYLLRGEHWAALQREAGRRVTDSHASVSTGSE